MVSPSKDPGHPIDVLAEVEVFLAEVEVFLQDHFPTLLAPERCSFIWCQGHSWHYPLPSIPRCQKSMADQHVTTTYVKELRSKVIATKANMEEGLENDPYHYQ